MKRFIAVFQVQIPDTAENSGGRYRNFTTIYADDLKQALDKWVTTSKTGEFLIEIKPQPSAQEAFNSVPYHSLVD